MHWVPRVRSKVHKVCRQLQGVEDIYIYIYIYVWSAPAPVWECSRIGNYPNPDLEASWDPWRDPLVLLGALSHNNDLKNDLWETQHQQTKNTPCDTHTDWFEKRDSSVSLYNVHCETKQNTHFQQSVRRNVVFVSWLGCSAPHASLMQCLEIIQSTYYTYASPCVSRKHCSPFLWSDSIMNNSSVINEYLSNETLIWNYLP